MAAKGTYVISSNRRLALQLAAQRVLGLSVTEATHSIDNIGGGMFTLPVPWESVESVFEFLVAYPYLPENSKEVFMITRKQVHLFERDDDE